MNEFPSYQPKSDDFPQIYPQEGLYQAQGVERVDDGYKFIEHVSADFPQAQNNLELRHKLELDADNTIVVVGDEVTYYGGPLTYQVIPGLKVDARNQAFGHRDLVSVKAIMEGRRVVVYATDHEKAMLFINERKKGEAA